MIWIGLSILGIIIIAGLIIRLAWLVIEVIWDFFF